MNEWAKRIRLLNEMGVPTKKIAATLGYSVTAVSMWVSGQTKPHAPDDVRARLRQMTFHRMDELLNEARKLY